MLLYTDTAATVQSISRQVDSADYANAVRLTGRDPEATGDSANVVERMATVAAEGRWDRSYSEDIVQLAALEQRADWTLAQSTVVRPSYTVELAPGFWSGPQHFWLGDTVTLVVKSGRLDVQSQLRVQQLKVDIDENDDEKISVTLGYPRKDFRERLASIDRRLERLERR
ncbi:phage tail protein [Pseudonocardia sp. ICBG1142]|uniref:phage tail protein n=1 Tax=Pseudonocardia sp. ICBG1142 TaxID=2846760 RepID=UPI001CF63B32|nr:phage tail protein [Pseudonocardia sp. ICBG1142]